MKVAVVGATGLVGQMMLRVLEERNFPVSRLIPIASERSIGNTLIFRGMKHPVVGMAEGLQARPAVALFSAGATVSGQMAGSFAQQGVRVIDNSSFWRMDPEIPLVVPEVNGSVLRPGDYIIANPNCSTIQMVVALYPLHVRYGIRRIVVSTYQSVTGTGVKAVQQLKNERLGWKGERAYPHPIDLNLIPHGGKFLEDGNTTEEEKLVSETRKIMGAPDIRVSATVVRVPVFGGHSESINVEFETDYQLEEVRQILAESPGVRLVDSPADNLYPMPLMAEGKDEVFVGRVRRDSSRERCLNLWVVSDNLRKGAATNAVQIAEYLIHKNFLE